MCRRARSRRLASLRDAGLSAVLSFDRRRRGTPQQEFRAICLDPRRPAASLAASQMMQRLRLICCRASIAVVFGACRLKRSMIWAFERLFPRGV